MEANTQKQGMSKVQREKEKDDMLESANKTIATISARRREVEKLLEEQLDTVDWATIHSQAINSEDQGELPCNPALNNWRRHTEPLLGQFSDDLAAVRTKVSLILSAADIHILGLQAPGNPASKFLMVMEVLAAMNTWASNMTQQWINYHVTRDKLKMGINGSSNPVMSILRAIGEDIEIDGNEMENIRTDNNGTEEDPSEEDRVAEDRDTEYSMVVNAEERVTEDIDVEDKDIDDKYIEEKVTEDKDNEERVTEDREAEYKDTEDIQAENGGAKDEVAYVEENIDIYDAVLNNIEDVRSRREGNMVTDIREEPIVSDLTSKTSPTFNKTDECEALIMWDLKMAKDALTMVNTLLHHYMVLEDLVLEATGAVREEPRDLRSFSLYR